MHSKRNVIKTAEAFRRFFFVVYCIQYMQRDGNITQTPPKQNICELEFDGKIIFRFRTSPRPA